MRHSLIIDRFEGEQAVLKAKDGATVIWPKNKLPDGIGEGAAVTFIISDDKEMEKNQKETAKNILNELLKTD